MKSIALLITSLVLSCQLFTVSVDNSSVETSLPPLEYYFPNSTLRGPYVPFDCVKTPVKFKIGVFPSSRFVSKKQIGKYVSSLFLGVNQIYKSQLNVEFVPVIYPIPPFKSINVIGDLNSFGRFLLTTKKKEKAYNIYLHNAYSGIVGASYIGVFGSNSQFNYGVSKDNVLTVSHEIGHAMGCQHTSSGIMAYQNQLINKVFQFSMESMPQICSYLGIILK